MKPDLYQRVALRRDVTEHSLRRGDVAVLVDHVPHPAGGEPGVVLEVFNAIGESLSVVAVKESDIEPLRRRGADSPLPRRRRVGVSPEKKSHKSSMTRPEAWRGGSNSPPAFSRYDRRAGSISDFTRRRSGSTWGRSRG